MKEESGGDRKGEPTVSINWVLGSLYHPEVRKTGSPERRRERTTQFVYDMIPKDGFEIQFKKLKEEADKINMSSATLSARLKNLEELGMINRRVVITRPINTFYSREEFSNSIDKLSEEMKNVIDIFNKIDEIEEIFPVLDHIDNQSTDNYNDLLMAFIDTYISAISATILILVYSTDFKFVDLPEDQNQLEELSFELEKTNLNSMKQFQEKIDLLVLPKIEKLLSLNFAFILKFKYSEQKGKSRFRRMLGEKLITLVKESSSDIKRFEELLDEYNQKIYQNGDDL